MSPLRHIYVLLFAVCAIPALTLTPATETQAQSTIDKPLENPADEARALAAMRNDEAWSGDHNMITDSATPRSITTRFGFDRGVY